MGTGDGRMERYDFLDWLRVIAIFVLFFFHTGMIFVGWGWHIVNAQTIPALAWPMDIAHRLRMPLLFLIAGAGMWFALQRRNAATFLRERTTKLLLPLVVGIFLIVPPQIYYERLLRGQWSGSFASFYATRVLQFVPYPSGNFSWHHLWLLAISTPTCCCCCRPCFGGSVAKYALRQAHGLAYGDCLLASTKFC